MFLARIIHELHRRMWLYVFQSVVEKACLFRIAIVERATSQQLSSIEGPGLVIIDLGVEKLEVCLDMLVFAFLPNYDCDSCNEPKRH